MPETAPPDDEPVTQASISRDDLPTAASMSNAEMDNRRTMPEKAPPNDEPLTQASSSRDDLPTAASLPRSEKGKRRTMPEKKCTF